MTPGLTSNVAATYHGKEGVLQAIAEWMERFADFSVTTKEFIDAESGW